MEEKDVMKAQSKAGQTAEEQTPAVEAARKKLAEMNLLDDFLFGSVVAYPEIGERFVKILLKTIFGREFRHLSVTAQKVFYGADTDLHGARLDVYIEPEEKEAEGKAAVYDIEPDQKDRAADKKALPRKMRFYHGKIAARSLNSGIGYDELKNVTVIMILPYDPFGLGRMVYTVKNKCIEEPEMEYEDGAATLFLYTKGTKEVPSEGLKQLLHYMEKSTIENAVNDDLKEVHRMVEMLKIDSETTVCFVGLMERLERSRQEWEAKGKAEGEAIGKAEGEAIGRAEGEAIGRAEGEAIGRAEGEAIGVIRGKAEGDLQRLVTQVCKKVKLGQSLEKIAEDLVEEVSAIEPIYNMAGKYAPGYDPKSVIEELAAAGILNTAGVNLTEPDKIKE